MKNDERFFDWLLLLFQVPRSAYEGYPKPLQMFLSGVYKQISSGKADD